MVGKKAWLLVILVIFFLTLCVTLQSDAGGPPLPNDINIIPPAADVPKDIAAFSGKWVGAFDYGLELILIVEEIHDTWGNVVFSRGDYKSYSVDAAFLRTRCKVISGPKAKIHVDTSKLTRGGDLYFELKDLNTLEIIRAGDPPLKGSLKRSN